jgi:tRNA U34 5-methylaminomethyl-2-thiouridine-forming methyltransferase MnmC
MKIAEMMVQGGVLVTYSAAGQVRRNLRDAGFEIQKIPGPPGKREMTRAIKR